MESSLWLCMDGSSLSGCCSYWERSQKQCGSAAGQNPAHNMNQFGNYIVHFSPAEAETSQLWGLLIAPWCRSWDYFLLISTTCLHQTISKWVSWSTRDIRQQKEWATHTSHRRSGVCSYINTRITNSVLDFIVKSHSGNYYKTSNHQRNCLFSVVLKGQLIVTATIWRGNVKTAILFNKKAWVKSLPETQSSNI